MHGLNHLKSEDFDLAGFWIRLLGFQLHVSEGIAPQDAYEQRKISPFSWQYAWKEKRGPSSCLFT